MSGHTVNKKAYRFIYITLSKFDVSDTIRIKARVVFFRNLNIAS